MTKWYENPTVDTHIIISSRVRLARNLANFHFPPCLSPPQAANAMEMMRGSIFNEKNDAMLDAGKFEFINLSNSSNWDLNILSEQHLISPSMVHNSNQRGVAHSMGGNVSIMFNEEDHVRIQALFVGKDLDAAFATANKMDDIMEETLNFAFDHEFGYLTSCPSNTGTGLRASYMLHIPLLEASGNLKKEMGILTKAGIVMRGIHGEGSDSLGSIYQISNQKTLGKSETYIMNELKACADQLVEKEHALRGTMVMDYLTEAKDSFWRSIGAVTNARKMSLAEAMRHLSEIRLGTMLGTSLGFCKNPAPTTIYNLMTNIQPFTLQKIMGPAIDARHLDMLRADYLRKVISSNNML